MSNRLNLSKKCIAVLMILIMAVSVSYKMPVKAESTSLRIGNVDTNGSISASDALLVLQHAAKLNKIDEELQEYADVNADGNINAEDALDILKFAARIIDKFKADEDKNKDNETLAPTDSNFQTKEPTPTEVVGDKQTPKPTEVGDEDGTPEPTNTKYVVSFNSDGGSDIEDQIVAKGDKAKKPENPEKEGSVFLGWYTDENFNVEFDFESPILQSCKVYARWLDYTDSTDTDGDKLSDELEKYFNTDLSKRDTDSDGLDDYVEIIVLNYDALNPDSDNNGVLDGEEDFDGDGFKNIEEIKMGLNPTLSDTDGDGVSDKEEVDVYLTNPFLEDTDEDGAIDGWEIKHSFNPLVFDGSFTVEIISNSSNAVTSSVTISESGTKVSSLQIRTVDKNNEFLLSSDIPGYLGDAYEFLIDGEISDAVHSAEPSGLRCVSERRVCGT